MVFSIENGTFIACRWSFLRFVTRRHRDYLGSNPLVVLNCKCHSWCIMTGNEHRRKNFNQRSVAGWQIISMYAVFGMAWIIWSDLLVDKVAVSKSMSTNMSMIKGCFFVAITSALLYFLLRFYRSNVLESHRRAGEAEDNYRNVFDNNPVPMWIYDLAQFRFLMVNEAATRSMDTVRMSFCQ